MSTTKVSLTIMSIWLSIMMVFGQVGINTENPQGIFHIDGMKNNNAVGAPTVGQLVDDVIITSGGNWGMGVLAPTNKLHIKATADPVKLEGLTASSTSTDLPLLVASDGTLKTGSLPVNIIPNDIGTVIAINGKLQVAQEITAIMSADYIVSGINIIQPIRNITNEIIDNKNTFSGTATGNSFSVVEDGIYLVMIHVQINTTTFEAGPTSTGLGGPVIGIIDNATNMWVARVNDAYPTPNNLQTYSLITTIPMSASTTYSFAASTSLSVGIAIRAMNGGVTGSAPISFFSIKRLK